MSNLAVRAGTAARAPSRMLSDMLSDYRASLTDLSHGSSF